ncbi:aspartyl protease [Thalassobacter stenotrophicus]|uniref:retropepsin-like aspartic protease family protein n=1 Tax=Thalassobacter TaxID=266808 RepID=UPI00051DDF65|nr:MULTISPECIES: TIGR02281 family clan AA aspartic protease [Thalassobacter]KGK80192.1 aspartyl protease [Thalassobacter stenotrophicus]KGL01177.1 aspartyl protease [Thalassobacter sp. 16PALIMAR09]
MTGDDIANLIYLSVLILVIGGYFIAVSRTNLPKMLQQGAIWVFIFIGAITVAGLWSEMGTTSLSRQSVIQTDGSTIVSAPRDRDGHYYLSLIINDAPIRFVVDTGATDLVLTKEDAARVGLDPKQLAYLSIANTANGQVRLARVRLDSVQLGDVTDQDVRAVVNEGDMRESLLGMTYLQKFGRIQIEGNRLTLIR